MILFPIGLELSTSDKQLLTVCYVIVRTAFVWLVGCVIVVGVIVSLLAGVAGLLADYRLKHKRKERK